MQNHDTTARSMNLHFIEADIKLRAELVKVGTSIGHHCELYADLSELAAYPPRSGIIIVRDGGENGGIDLVLERLLALGISLPVIAMDFQPNPTRVVFAIKEGALDYLVLPLQPERFAASLARISNEASLAAAARQRMIEARGRISTLSGREREVLDGLSGGNSNKAIARQLEISPRTVEIHRANLMNKLGARHSVEAVRLKIEARIDTPAFLY